MTDPTTPARPKTPFEQRFEAAISTYLRATGWPSRFADAGAARSEEFMAGVVGRAREQVDAYAERHLRALRQIRAAAAPPPATDTPEEQP